MNVVMAVHLERGRGNRSIDDDHIHRPRFGRVVLVLLLVAGVRLPLR